MDEQEEAMRILTGESPAPAPAPMPITGGAPPQAAASEEEAALKTLTDVDVRPEHGPITADTPWTEVGKQALTNFPSDIYRTGSDVVGGIKQLVTHPVQTAENLYNNWDAIKEELKKDYLTEEGWKKGVGERPVSRLMDISMLLAGPEALAARAAGKAGMTGLAKGINVASMVHDPAQWAVQGTKIAGSGAAKLQDAVLGHMATYSGEESLGLAREAGRLGGKPQEAFQAGKTGSKLDSEVVDAFDNTFDKIKVGMQREYQADARLVGMDQQRLDLNGLLTKLDDIERDFVNPYYPTRSPAYDALQEMRMVIGNQLEKANQWDQMQSRIPFAGPNFRGPNPHLSPTQLDDLKQTIGGIAAANKGNSKAHAAASKMRGYIADEIKSKAPVYADMMDNYSQGMELLNALKGELSLGNKGKLNKGTVLRKLRTILKNNVTGNYGYRHQLVEKMLAKDPELRNAIYQLAGQELSAKFPRTLPGAFMSALLPTGATGALAHFALGASPFATIPMAVAAQSPRLMGNMANLEGKAARYMSHVPWRPGIYGGYLGSSPFLDAINE